MDAVEFNKRMKDLYGLVSGDLAKDAIELPSAVLYASIKKRVFTQGLNSNNKPIGNYSTKPMYASKSQFARSGAFKAQGKNNKFGNTMGDRLIPSARLRTNNVKKNPTKYKNFTLVKPNYKRRTSMYLANGYRELREVQNMRTDTVDLTYRGNLKKDWALSKSEQAYEMGFTDIFQSQKRLGLENKYGPIFYPTDAERKKYLDAVNFTLQRLTAGILQGQVVTATLE